MLDFQPPMLARPGEITITPWSYQSLGVPLISGGFGTVSSQNSVAANVVLYIPFQTVTSLTVRKTFWGNGAAVSGNIDVGVYDLAGTLLVSAGSTGQSGTTRVQVADVTDTALAAGTYYLAFVADTAGSTSRFLSVVPSAGICQALGILQQAAVTLPLATNASPATFAKGATAWVPMVGLQATRTIGP